MQLTDPIATILSGMIGGVLAAIASALFTRYVERRRNIESFRISLIQKRVDTALRIQAALQDIANQFLNEIEQTSDTNRIGGSFIGIRRKIVSLAEETAFTNILIYGYISGAVYSGILHNLDLSLKPTDFKNDLRRRMNFILAGYSLMLLRSTLDFWNLEPDTGDLSIAQAWAKTDYENWLNVGKSFHKFTSVVHMKSNRQLLAEVRKHRKAIPRQ